MYWAYSTDEKSDSHRNAYPTLCAGFSRRNRYSKKECTGRTRLMKKSDSHRNASPTLCVGFSRRNRYSKKECTGRTRLMKKSDLYRKSKQRLGVCDSGGSNLRPTQYPSHFHNSLPSINTLNGSNSFIA